MIISAIASILISGLNGKIASLAGCDKLAIDLVNLMNKGDSGQLSRRALPEFFDEVPREQLPGLVDQLHKAGTLSSPKRILDLGELRRYRVTITRKSKPPVALLMVLGAESESKFFKLTFLPIGKQTESVDSIKTDNPQRSIIDRTVHQAVAGETMDRVGMSIGVLHGSRQLIYNYQRSKSEALPNQLTVYEIGSITKTMTGLLLADAIQQKRLDIDQDIRKYLPGSYPILEFLGNPITVRHLVTHTSGLPVNPPGIPDDAKADAYERFSHAKLLEDLRQIKLSRPPGVEFSYSNMGAGLVGLILEQVFAKSYEELLQTKLFRPFRMNHSGIALNPVMESNYATPFDSSGVRTDRWTVNGIEAAGGIRSTVKDMLKFAQLCLSKDDVRVSLARKVQSKGTKPNLGLLWPIYTSRLGGQYVSHEGGTGGFSCHLLAMPEKRLAVVVLTNGGEQPTGDLAYEIALRILSAKA